MKITFAVEAFVAEELVLRNMLSMHCLFLALPYCESQGEVR